MMDCEGNELDPYFVKELEEDENDDKDENDGHETLRSGESEQTDSNTKNSLKHGLVSLTNLSNDEDINSDAQFLDKLQAIFSKAIYL